MEKGKSAKSPVKEEGSDIEKHKDKDDVMQKAPAREPFVLFRPSTSVSRPDTSVISRPAPVVSKEKTTVPSVAPSEEDLPEYISGNPSLSPSQFPSVSTVSVNALSSSPSNVPSTNNEINPSTSPSEIPTKHLAQLSEKPSQAPSFLNETHTSEQKYSALNETEVTEQSNSTIGKGSTLKISISGNEMSQDRDSSIVSISENGKVSLSGTDVDSTDASTKVSMAGALSDTKYDDLNISISKRGKVSFSDNKEETHEPTTAPNENERISSNKISMKDFRRSIDFEDSTPTPSYTPTYLPTSHDIPHSTKNHGKLTLSFPLSRGPDNKGDNTNSSPSSTHDLKPISYYTELPTTLSTSLEPTSPPSTLKPSSIEPSTLEPSQRNKNTQTPTIHDDTDEPTSFVYPTYYPTSSKESRMNYASSNPTYLPSYTPTYIPTLETEGKDRHFFGFGDASGRENNSESVINAPEIDDKFNITSNNDETSDFMAANPPITSDQDDGYKFDETDDCNDLYQKRICPGFPLGVDPAARKKEQEVLFIYGIYMTKSSDDFTVVEAVEELQLHILDDVAMAMLRCGQRGKKSVSRVYYKGATKKGQTHQESTEISSLSSCANSNSKQQCAIVESAIYLSVTEGQEDESRVEALSVINHRLERRKNEEYTHYLGPNIEQLEGYLERKNNSIKIASSNAESSGNPYLFYGAIAVVSIAIFTLIGFAVMAERNRKKRKAASQYERFSSINSTLNSKNNVHTPPSELSDWRSLVGCARF
eukprot:scaffold292056_cov99-Cyclotella_meneghiniana.AAC.2